RVLKNGPSSHRGLMSAIAAFQTHRPERPRLASAAATTPKSPRQTQPDQIPPERLLSAKTSLQLVDIPRIVFHRHFGSDHSYYILGLPASSEYPTYYYWGSAASYGSLDLATRQRVE